ncbi:class I adenylate-forming enzyme family protein [Acuticoccus kandeliae]|uniref:class I adenylate-forming enzyme family protein n=1 Tax=Acuticoccus kandeliae TaxID=2073160 RepID=UPI000D3EB986|nr:AMP-binding protein [Acuticoccus kandeliae]
MDLFAPIERHAAFDPDKVAIRFEGDETTYAALAARVRAIAEGFVAAGVGPGDRIGVLSENHPDILAILYAAARIGAIMAPLNWRLADAELAFALVDCAPKILAYGPGYQDRAEALAAEAKGAFALRAMGPGRDLATAPDGAPPRLGSPGAECLLVYTSGTTGRPKGALISQGALRGNAIQSQHMHQMSAADHVLTVLPMFHVGGLNIQTTPALMAGATVTIHARFEPEATLRAIEAERPSLTLLVPTTMQAVLAQPGFAAADLSSLRALSTGSTIVPEALMEAFEARGVPVLSVYGATETCPIAAYDRLGLPRRKGGTGQAGLFTDLVIFDDRGRVLPAGAHGEIGVKGAIFSGYLGNAAATREAYRDGYVLTGDIGSLAPDGTLTVHDRKKNMIVSGGENIYPAEVERVLAAHAAVVECAVVGRPDPRWQEVPVAFVRCTGPVDPEALIAHMKAHIASYKVARDIRIVDDFPRTALGKIRHDVLRSIARGEARDVA